MFDIISCFIIAAIISFIGSLQLGPVNLNVIQTAINKGFKTSLWVAIGGSIPEIIYSSLAFFGAEVFIHNAAWLSGFQIASVFVFLLFGILSIRKKDVVSKENTSSSFSFLSGFLLGMLNPLLITFWLSIIIYLQSFNHSLSTSLYSKIAFVIGTSVGAFLLLFVFARVVTKNKTGFIYRQQKNINKLIGIIFIILAGIQFIKLVV